MESITIRARLNKTFQHTDKLAWSTHIVDHTLFLLEDAAEFTIPDNVFYRYRTRPYHLLRVLDIAEEDIEIVLRINQIRPFFGLEANQKKIRIPQPEKLKKVKETYTG